MLAMSGSANDDRQAAAARSIASTSAMQLGAAAGALADVVGGRRLRPAARRSTGRGTGGRPRSRSRGSPSPGRAAPPAVGRPPSATAGSRRSARGTPRSYRLQQQPAGDSGAEHQHAHDRQHQGLPALHGERRATGSASCVGVGRRPSVVIRSVRSTRTTAMSSESPPCSSARSSAPSMRASTNAAPGRCRPRPGQFEQAVLAEAFVADAGVPLEQPVGQQQQTVPRGQLQLARPASPCRRGRARARGRLQPLAPSRGRAAACRDGRRGPR